MNNFPLRLRATSRSVSTPLRKSHAVPHFLTDIQRAGKSPSHGKIEEHQTSVFTTDPSIFRRSQVDFQIYFKVFTNPPTRMNTGFAGYSDPGDNALSKKISKNLLTFSALSIF